MGRATVTITTVKRPGIGGNVSIQNRDKIVALVGERKFRVLLAYIAMSSKAFERGRINLYRFSFAKPSEINDRGDQEHPSEDALAKPGLNTLWRRKWMEFHSGINPPREGQHWKDGDKVPRFPTVPPPPEGINPWTTATVENEAITNTNS